MMKRYAPFGSQLPKSPLEIHERIADLTAAFGGVFFHAALVNFEHVPHPLTL